MSSQALLRLQLLLDDCSAVLAMIVSPTSVTGRGAWLCSVGAEESKGEVQNEGVSFGEGERAPRVLLSCAVKAKQKKAFSRSFRRDVPTEIVEVFLVRFCEPS